MPFETFGSVRGETWTSTDPFATLKQEDGFSGARRQRMRGDAAGPADSAGRRAALTELSSGSVGLPVSFCFKSHFKHTAAPQIHSDLNDV